MVDRSEKIQKVVLVIISILLAFFLWLYVMGEKNPIQNKVLSNVPVVLTNTDSITKNNMVLMPDQTFSMNLTLSGRAFDLVKITMNDVKIEADMGGGLKKGVNNIPVKITYPQNRVNIITKNKSSYITVKLDALVEKTVPVNINIIGKVKEGYGYSKPIARPSEILVSGPSSYVEAVYSASGQMNISGNHSLISGAIAINPQDKNGEKIPHVNVAPAYIDATVSIKPCKEVPIKISSYGVVGNNRVLKAIKPHLEKMVIMGDNRYLSQISEINTAALDLSKINNSMTVKLPINLPLGVSSVDSISNVRVDITLENKIKKTITYNVTLKNESQTYNYNLSSNSTTVTLEGPESIMNTIDSSSLTPDIDVGSLTEGMQTVPINIGQIDGVDIKSVTPAQLEVDVTTK